MQGVADQVRRRLVAGIENEDAVLEKLDIGKLLAFVALDQPRQDVGRRIARFGAPTRDEILEIGLEVDDGAVAALLLFGGKHGVRAHEDRQRPVAQRPALLVRHNEKIADDLHGDRGGEVLDEIGLAPLGDPVEKTVDERDEAGLHRGDRARGQRPIMIRRTRVCSGGSLKTRLVV